MLTFELYGQQYKLYDGAPKYKQGSDVHAIHAGEVQNRAYSALLESGNITNLELEKLAVDCMRYYFSDFDCELVTMGDKINLVSTKRGSFAVVTDTGGIYNLVLRHPRDAFVITRLGEQWPENHGYVEIGTRTFDLYERVGFEWASLQNGIAEVVRFNFKDENKVRDVHDYADEFGLTIWELCK